MHLIFRDIFSLFYNKWNIAATVVSISFVVSSNHILCVCNLKLFNVVLFSSTWDCLPRRPPKWWPSIWQSLPKTELQSNWNYIKLICACFKCADWLLKNHRPSPYPCIDDTTLFLFFQDGRHHFHLPESSLELPAQFQMLREFPNLYKYLWSFQMPFPNFWNDLQTTFELWRLPQCYWKLAFHFACQMEGWLPIGRACMQFQWLIYFHW